ncbi:acylneuraminate cytidylyltransferase family protein [Labilibaculum euxinus]
MKILAIIPARGGSKRLPRKNILPLAGKPLIAWSIEAAQKSAYVTDVLVSTDDIEIASIAKDYGAWVPFLRPQNLSTDTSSSYDVVEHTINFCEKLNKSYDLVLLLQPTSPLRCAEDIDAAVNLLNSKSADAVISVCEAEHSPIWSNTLPDNLNMDLFENEKYRDIRSQDLPTYYRLNGAIYLLKTERLLTEKSFSLNRNTFAYVMKQERSIDIDTKLDFCIAETILNYKGNI